MTTMEMDFTHKKSRKLLKFALIKSSTRYGIDLKSIPFNLAAFLATMWKPLSRGISFITLTWFPHGSKKDCQQKWNKP